MGIPLLSAMKRLWQTLWSTLYSSCIRNTASELCTSSPHKPLRDLVPTTENEFNRAKLFALIIGIDRYQSNQINSLCGAVADADAMYRYLVTELQVPDSCVKILRNEEATREAVIQAFLDLRNDHRITPGDPILIYYAGHGAEQDAPAGWFTPDAKIQMIVPHDCNTVVDGRTIQGIPDRTIGALLQSLAGVKGNNITVVLDCCHSGSGTREDDGRIPRGTMVASLSDDLDKDIWTPPSNVRAKKIPPGFLYNGLQSHVVMSTCMSQEIAYEDNGRGVFTTAFMKTLARCGTDKVTYAELLLRMPALPAQNPQCEGAKRHSVMFNSRVHSPRRIFYEVVLDEQMPSVFRLHAGAANGITEGAKFDVYGTREWPSLVPPMGTITVTKPMTMHSFGGLAEDSPRIEPVGQMFALQVRAGKEESLSVHIPRDNSRLQPTINVIQQFIDLSDSTRLQLILVDSMENAALGIDLERDQLVYNLAIGSLGATSLNRMPFTTSQKEIDDMISVLHATAHFTWHVHRTNPTSTFNTGGVSFEFNRLKATGRYEDFVEVLGPDSENLIHGGVVTLEADEETLYGMKIVNHTDMPLYPGVFYFDCSDLSITPYFVPPVAKAESDVPLPPRGSMTIGYGSSGTPPRIYYLREQQDRDIGIIKVFLPNKPVDFRDIQQPSPFLSGRKAKQVCPDVKEVWDTMTIAIIQTKPAPRF